MRHLATNGLTALGVLTLIACSDVTDLYGPDGRELQKGSMLNLDVAMVSADAFIEDVAELQFDFGDVIGGVFAEPGDTVRVRPDPLKRVREVTYYDADGNKQDAYDGITTASVNIVSEISGERARDSWSSSVSRTRDIMITGLEGSEVTRTANGFGSSTRSRSYHSDENGDRSYEMSSTSVIKDVVRAVPEEENNPFVRREKPLYPLSGTIARDVNVVIVNGPNGDETRTKHVVITFNGTQFVTMTVDGESIEVDLAARKGRHPLRGRGGNGAAPPPNCRGNGPPPGAGNGGNRPPPPNCRGNGPPPPPGMGNRPPQPPEGGGGRPPPPPVRRGNRPPPISG